MAENFEPKDSQFFMQLVQLCGADLAGTSRMNTHRISASFVFPVLAESIRFLLSKHF